MVAIAALPDVLLSEIAAAFRHCRVLGAWLCSGHGRGAARPGSDIDRWGLCDEPLDRNLVAAS
jgi:hypothetical protein